MPVSLLLLRYLRANKESGTVWVAVSSRPHMYCILEQLASDAGRVPVSTLLLSSSMWRLVRLPISGGMVPPIVLPSSKIRVAIVKLPIEEGMVPLSPLEERTLGLASER